MCIYVHIYYKGCANALTCVAHLDQCRQACILAGPRKRKSPKNAWPTTMKCVAHPRMF